MIHIEKELWHDIPILVIVDSEKKKQPLPVLTYMHGFTSAKEHNLPFAYLMAEKGYRVLLPDCFLHGERIEDTDQTNRQMRFFEIIKQNILDLKLIKDTLEQRGLLLDDRFGLAGTSMGGITTAAALTQYSWIKSAAILMGTPKITMFARQIIQEVQKQGMDLRMSLAEIEAMLESLHTIDLSMQPEILAGRPLFFWHGDKDKVVPFDHAHSFHQQIVGDYKNQESIRFLPENGAGHQVSRLAILETVKWFELQL
ncbi:prolyl oligopeptidase family serine peptidase [Paraliobacillus sediminis]|uniref:prolyl oligopeptidase family serine peptidase n=1 Tax=Paraliobacillus sediminis TaxID=1885916 RepID=UPI000E3BBAC5|nr:prolyl oligopeptidase family serine peptidase [Paraliobacillus sediminis]